MFILTFFSGIIAFFSWAVICNSLFGCCSRCSIVQETPETPSEAPETPSEISTPRPTIRIPEEEAFIPAVRIQTPYQPIAKRTRSH
jgi:hypothetical protein